MGTWAQEWFELNPEDSDLGFLLHNWCERYLAVDQLPERRVVIRFDFTDQPPSRRRLWMLVDEDAAAHLEQAQCLGFMIAAAGTAG